MKDYIRINELDNVIACINNIHKDTVLAIDENSITVLEDVDAGHKIAIRNIKKGENVIKYGMPIGYANTDIKCGEKVHTHNVKTNLDGVLEYNYNKEIYDIDFSNVNRTFMGYRRKNDDVGIRNEIFIVPTVGCVNAISDTIIEKYKRENDISDIDGIHVFKHPFGCSQMGDDHIRTRTILQNIVKHPNAGGVLVFGLGCENNTIKEFKETLGKYDSERVKFLVAQDVEDEIEEGVKLLGVLHSNMKEDIRQECPISSLKIGLKCGGSDGFSGITANPLLGVFSDYLIAQGGTTVLTEVPEMFGAETLLMNRAKNEIVYNDIVDLINNFKKYFMRYNQVVYENPSPGNKDGGITTLEEKSLGCVQKGGFSEVVDVLAYGEIVKTSGLNILDGPGNDLVACTSLAASGCQIVLFTTGRGTPFGTFVPTIKVSTNRDLAIKKKHWIDFNAGELIADKKLAELLSKFVDYIISVADGEKTKNEINNFREISIFKDGVTL